MRPEDREWLSQNKLSNAFGLVQDYLQGLQASGRSAPRVGRASTDVPAGVSTPTQAGVGTPTQAGVGTPTQSGKATSKQKESGRPARAKQPEMAESGVKKRSSACLRKTH